MNYSETLNVPNRNPVASTFRKLGRSAPLYFILLPALAYLIVFKYIPIYGVQIAFRDFNVLQGIRDSEWVGWKNLTRFLSSNNFYVLLRNTLGISFYNLAIGFPLPIVLALSINEIQSGFLKRSAQMITYVPYFISTVVAVAIMFRILDPRYGPMSTVSSVLGFEMMNVMAEARLFSTIYVGSEVWQRMGYSSIIYLAALSTISPALYEAAYMDGAKRWQRIAHIDVPGIAPTAVVLLILNAGRVLDLGFEKVFLMQNPLNLARSEIINTFIYKIGLIHADFSYAAAVGLFNSAVNFFLLVAVHGVSRRVSNDSETLVW